MGLHVLIPLSESRRLFSLPADQDHSSPEDSDRPIQIARSPVGRARYAEIGIKAIAPESI